MSTGTLVLYACGAVLLIALRPNFSKIAGKRMAPSLVAALYTTVVFLFYLVGAILTKDIRSMLSVDNSTFLKLLGAGAIRAAIWLCLFAALSTGQVNRVVPIYLLSDVALIILSLALGRSKAGIWRLCCIVLVLLGTVMAESRPTRSKSGRWLLFSFLAMILNIGLTHYTDKFLWETSADIIRLSEAGVALLLLWILSVAGNAVKTFKKAEAENWIFVILAGLCGGLTVYCEMKTAGIGDATILNPIRCAVLPLTALASRLINKEKMPAGAVLGIALFTAGTFGLMLNF